MMLATLKAENDLAMTTLNLAGVTQDNAPDLGTSAHGAQPFPAPSGLDDWKNGGNWKES